MSDTIEVTGDERNAAAHLWADTFATDDDPLEGISVGWKGQESSVQWLNDIRAACADGGPDVDAIEIADAAVPIYTAEAHGILGELPLWVLTEDWSERIGLGPDVGASDTAEMERRALFGIAYEIASAVLAGRTEV